MTDWVDALIANRNALHGHVRTSGSWNCARSPLMETWLNVNRRCAEIVGYPKEELLGLKFNAKLLIQTTSWPTGRSSGGSCRAGATVPLLEKRYFTH